MCECECVYALSTKCHSVHCVVLGIARRFGGFEYQRGRVIMEFENWCCLQIWSLNALNIFALLFLFAFFLKQYFKSGRTVVEKQGIIISSLID